MACAWTAWCDPCGTTRSTPCRRPSGLLAMPVAGAAGVAAPLGAIASAGLALALSTTFNPLIGGLFSLVYGAVIARGRAARRVSCARLLRHAIAASACRRSGDVVRRQRYGRRRRGCRDLRLRRARAQRANCHAWSFSRPAARSGAARLVAASKLRAAHWPSVAGTILGLLVFYLVRISRDAAVHRISRRSTAAGRAARPRGGVFRPPRCAEPCDGGHRPPRCSSRSVCRPRSSTHSTPRTSAIARWGPGSDGRSR